MSGLFKKRKRPVATIVQTSPKQELSDDGEQDDGVSSLLSDMRDVQKMRERTTGISAIDLTNGPKKTEKRKGELSDPFKSATGGMVNVKTLTAEDIASADIEENIRGQFSKESHMRDEDAEMRRYVEEELRRRRREAGHDVPDEEAGETPAHPIKKSRHALFDLAAEKVKKFHSKRDDAMMSQQMLSGIPEVDLGVHAKIRTVERTEEAKLKLLAEHTEKKRKLAESTRFTQDIMEHVAKDYVQHHIYNITPTTGLGTLATSMKSDENDRLMQFNAGL